MREAETSQPTQPITHQDILAQAQTLGFIKPYEHSTSLYEDPSDEFVLLQRMIPEAKEFDLRGQRVELPVGFFRGFDITIDDWKSTFLPKDAQDFFDDADEHKLTHRLTVLTHSSSRPRHFGIEYNEDMFKLRWAIDPFFRRRWQKKFPGESRNSIIAEDKKEKFAVKRIGIGQDFYREISLSDDFHELTIEMRWGFEDQPEISDFSPINRLNLIVRFEPIEEVEGELIYSPSDSKEISTEFATPEQRAWVGRVQRFLVTERLKQLQNAQSAPSS